MDSITESDLFQLDQLLIFSFVAYGFLSLRFVITVDSISLSETESNTDIGDINVGEQLAILLAPLVCKKSYPTYFLSLALSLILPTEVVINVCKI